MAHWEHHTPQCTQGATCERFRKIFSLVRFNGKAEHSAARPGIGFTSTDDLHSYAGSSVKRCHCRATNTPRIHRRRRFQGRLRCLSSRINRHIERWSSRWESRYLSPCSRSLEFIKSILERNSKSDWVGFFKHLIVGSSAGTNLSAYRLAMLSLFFLEGLDESFDFWINLDSI